jgi:hypothetical protein
MVKISISSRQYELLKISIERSEKPLLFTYNRNSITIENDEIVVIDSIIDSLFDYFYDNGINSDSRSTNIGKELLQFINFLRSEQNNISSYIPNFKKVIATKSKRFIKTAYWVLGSSILFSFVPVILAILLKVYLLLLVEIVPIGLIIGVIYIFVIYKITPKDILAVAGSYLYITTHQVELIRYGKHIFIKDKPMIYRLSDITSIKAEKARNSKGKFLPNGRIVISTNVGMTLIVSNLEFIDGVVARLEQTLDSYNHKNEFNTEEE